MTHMRQVLIVDPAGWVHTLVQNEGPGARPAAADEHPVPVTTYEDALAMEAFRVREGRVEVPHDDRAAWRRYRQLGHTGADSLHRCRTLEAVRARYPDAGAPSGPVAPGSLHGRTFTFAEVPGLTIEPFGGDDLDVLAPAMVAGGLQPATCPPECGRCRPPEAHAWLQTAARLANADSWQFRLAFNGRALQHEIIQRDDTGFLATFSLTVHHSRERPSWFWREAERPVFAYLQERNVRFMQSRTRADRPDWIQSLQDNYGARVVGPWPAPRQPGDPQTVRLEFPLDASVFKGWPARHQVGLDELTGRVRTWEATPAELPAVRQLIDDTVPVGQRAIALQVLEEWWHLDRATVLLGARDGVLRYARTIRHRRAGQASLAVLGALFDEPEQAQVTAAIRTWCQRAGYTTVSSFIPDRLLATPQMQAQMARGNVRVVGKRPLREPFTEVIADV